MAKGHTQAGNKLNLPKPVLHSSDAINRVATVQSYLFGQLPPALNNLKTHKPLGYWITILTGFLLFATTGIEQVNAQGLGLNNPTPDASAILDLSATDRGLLIPRMTTTQRTAIGSPATGLLVFDTDMGEFYFFNGTVWVPITDPDGDWTESGNYWTNTTDSFGIGVSPPTAPLHVVSTGNYTIRGVTSGATGRGLYGQGTHVSGANYGIYGESNSTNGIGVFGDATTASGITWGIYGQNASTDGRGVYGYAFATSGTNYGAWGQSASSSGIGVYGWNNSATGTTYGIYGDVTSPDGYAGYFTGGNGYFSDSLGVGTLNPSNNLTVSGDADFTGKVGIGISSPTEILHVQSATSPYITVENTTTAAPFGIFLDNATRDWFLLHSPGGSDRLAIYDGTRADEVMVFEGTTGNVGIGNTTPDYKLDVTGDARIGWHGSSTRIKILPSDFIASDGGGSNKDVQIKSSAPRGVRPNFCDAGPTVCPYYFAFVPIPAGYMATDIIVYGNNTNAIIMYDADLSTGTYTQQGTSGSVGTTFDFPDFNSTSTNCVALYINTGVAGDVFYGAFVTIAPIP